MTVTLNTDGLQDSSHPTAFSYIQYYRMKCGFWPNEQDSKSHTVMANCYYAMIYEIRHLNPASIYLFPASTLIKVTGRNKVIYFFSIRFVGTVHLLRGGEDANRARTKIHLQLALRSKDVEFRKALCTPQHMRCKGCVFLCTR